METESCLPFSSQSGGRTPTNSPGQDHGGGGSGSFLPCDELHKSSHLRPTPPAPHPLTHRLGLCGDLYATTGMGRFGDAADFTNGSATASPPKHSKFLDSLNLDHKAAINDKAAFYESSSEGEKKQKTKANTDVIKNN